METVSKPRHVVLVGMMGAGKSTVGRKLAARLDRVFYDTDEVIEEQEGATIRDLFEYAGEAYFRKVELETICRLMNKTPAVVALGGGAFLTEGVREALVSHSVSFYLRVERDALVSRLSRSRNRPLLLGHNLEERVIQLLAERDPVYMKADRIIECGGLSTHRTASAVLRHHDLFESSGPNA